MIKKLIWKIRYALHMRHRLPGIPWREAWYLAGAGYEAQIDEPEMEPTDAADEEISYMAQDMG